MNPDKNSRTRDEGVHAVLECFRSNTLDINAAAAAIKNIFEQPDNSGNAPATGLRSLD